MLDMNEENSSIDELEPFEAVIIKPTVGRVVLYHVPRGDFLTTINDQPIPALVTAVLGDRAVNLHAFDTAGVSSGRASVRLIQPNDDIPDDGAGYCYWMDYQIGQASKTEELQAAMAKGLRHSAANYQNGISD